MAESKIEWTDYTHNFWTGCTKVSPACDHCYAETISLRYKRAVFGKDETRWRPSKDTLQKPLLWNKKAKKNGERKRVFTLSMGDFFDTEVPLEWREEAWEMIKKTNYLDWLVLTKRVNKIIECLPQDFQSHKAKWRHVWIGCTVENQEIADLRVPLLQKVPSSVKFLSVEPLLGPIEFQSLEGIDWVIVGGESGLNHRPMEEKWVMDIKKQCEQAGVKFFFKQWGGRTPKANGRELKGKTYEEFPVSPANVAQEKKRKSARNRIAKHRKKNVTVTIPKADEIVLKMKAEESGQSISEFLSDLIKNS